MGQKEKKRTKKYRQLKQQTLIELYQVLKPVLSNSIQDGKKMGHFTRSVMSVISKK